jgi:hypothetical protein
MIPAKKLAPGEKVTADGVYLMSSDRYHGDCTAGPGVSSSGLRTIETKSPAHYFATSYLNPKREDPSGSDHFNIGRAAHTLLLGESGFRTEYAIRPAEFPDWRTNAAKAWRSEQQIAGKTVLTPDQVDAIRNMSESLARHPLISAGLLQGEVERSLIFKDRTGVWLKSRPDVIPVADGVVVDLKTTTDASPDAIRRAILEHSYAMQGALVGKGLAAVLDMQMTSFVLVFVEKTAPFAVNVVEVDSDWIGYARRQLRRAIDVFARCVETGTWPGYEGERTVYLPDWLRKRLDEDADAGLLPREDAA